MEIKKDERNPTLEPTIHAVAKPVARAAAWSMVGAGAVALALAAVRTVREG